MRNGQPRRPGKATAAELAAELSRDPEFRGREQAEQRRRAEARAAYDSAAAPLLGQLAQVGFRVDNVRQLRLEFERTGRRYEAAVPALLEWLPRVTYPPLRWDIVETLAVPWAKREAAGPLIDLFRSLPRHAGPSQDPRWEVGNALEALAHPAVADDLLEIAQDRRYGHARQPVVLGLGKLKKDPRVVPALIGLLDDPDVVGFAIVVLGRLKAEAARAPMERLLDHPEPSIQREARRALAKLGT
jgi:hypothetical protein